LAFCVSNVAVVFVFVRATSLPLALFFARTTSLPIIATNQTQKLSLVDC